MPTIKNVLSKITSPLSSSPPPWRARRPALAAFVAGSALACFTVTAQAQEYAPRADPPPTFMTLDRMDGTTRFGLQTGFTKDDGTSVSDAFGLRFELYGQVMLPNRNVGLYGSLPFSMIVVDGADNPDGIGNLEVGAFALVGGRNDLILRFGASLPTASDDLEGFAANAATVYERTTDILGIIPDYTVLRLSLSTLQEHGAAFIRADGGFDIVADGPGGIDNRLFARGNLAAGLRTSALDFTLELVNIGYLDGDGDVDERFIHTAALGLRTRGQAQFHAGMVFPLDEDARGELWILSFGLQRAL